jgi:hypothetical protein
MLRACKVRAVLLCAVVSLGGCAGPRFVNMDASGGVVAIPSNSNCWPNYYRDEAIKMIASRCPDGYVIDQEHEVVVGSTTRQYGGAEGQTNGPLASVVGVTKTETRALKEWQITFHRKPTPQPVALQVPPPAAPAPAPPPGLPPRPIPITSATP